MVAVVADVVTGFRHARIAPKPNKSLEWARARYRSSAGAYESDWRFDETGYITLEITSPFNAEASLVLPGARLEEVSINGQALDEGE
ncbi:MAG: hypothetical protein IT320_15560 [Anaerolineae bacterium]|nr:hypothetical protein [Anaerolineae bacterium]